MLIKGKDLNKSQLEIVLRVFSNRFWSIGPNKYYKTEKDWINDHAFHFIKDGSRLNANYKSCVPHYFADLNKK